MKTYKIVTKVSVQVEIDAESIEQALQRAKDKIDARLLYEDAEGQAFTPLGFSSTLAEEKNA